MNRRYEEVKEDIENLKYFLIENGVKFDIQAKHLYHDREEVTVYLRRTNWFRGILSGHLSAWAVAGLLHFDSKSRHKHDYGISLISDCGDGHKTHADRPGISFYIRCDER